MGWRRQYPDSDEYKALFDGNFADYRLRISGLVANLVELDLAQLRALPHHEQITQHFCIQGWSGVAKWGGVSMQTIVDLVEPHPEAKWVIFYSLRGGGRQGCLLRRAPDRAHEPPAPASMSHHQCWFHEHGAVSRASRRVLNAAAHGRKRRSRRLASLRPDPSLMGNTRCP